MKKVIYHKNCYDGFTAAWVARTALGDASFLPAAYGDPVPEDFGPEDEVYILDFSYPRDILEAIASKVKKLQVLDHHHTAREALQGLPYCEFDMERSGAGMAWDYFTLDFDGEKATSLPRPPIVDYVEDRDLWRFKLPHTRAIHAYLSSYPMEFKEWDARSESLKSNFNKCVEIGTALMRYASQKVEEVIKNGTQWRDIGGFQIPCVNVPYHMGSDVGHRLLDLHPNAPFAGYYLFTANGDEQWGLRGRDSDDFDVSEIAKQYGGGGHKKASGFLMNRSTRG